MSAEFGTLEDKAGAAKAIMALCNRPLLTLWTPQMLSSFSWQGLESLTKVPAQAEQGGAIRSWPLYLLSLMLTRIRPTLSSIFLFPGGQWKRQSKCLTMHTLGFSWRRRTTLRRNSPARISVTFICSTKMEKYIVCLMNRSEMLQKEPGVANIVAMTG
jgi:hypothetical protein